MRYTREDGCRAWLTYGQLTPENLRGVLAEFGSAEALYDRFCQDSGEFLRDRMPQRCIDQLRKQCGRTAMHEMMQTMHRLSIGIMHEEDICYPDDLRHIQEPPVFLFYRGDPDCLLGKCITVVGTRRASPEGIDATHRICRALSEAGVTIVSGFALGIDSAAHEGCLAGHSPTIAVLSTGIDVDYPIENTDLKERIVRKGGLLLSEYPPGMRSSKFVFQMRNRILSGLSKATLMMESRIRSGSMITVQHALDQGREVYAYPGIPGTAWAEGAHQLLREGASFFTSAQDILEDLNWADDLPMPTSQQKKELPPMSEDQRKVYTVLGRGEMSYDQLAAETALPAPTLSVALTMLQMMGLIKAMPGKTYQRN